MVAERGNGPQAPCSSSPLEHGNVKESDVRCNPEETWLNLKSLEGQFGHGEERDGRARGKMSPRTEPGDGSRSGAGKGTGKGSGSHDDDDGDEKKKTEDRRV